MSKSFFLIEGDFRLPGTDIILEEGDQIALLGEAAPKMKVNKAVSNAMNGVMNTLEALEQEYSSSIDGKSEASALRRAINALGKINWERAPEVRGFDAYGNR